jgi:cation diffusion facilitator family transporter
VIALCGAMMIAEIIGGMLFGSIALVADGLHMSTHAGALLLAAFAYTYARKQVDDPRFTFGTGKLGDLAGFTSGIILGMIALLIGYESASRIFAPIEIDFAEAIPIVCLALPSTLQAHDCSSAAEIIMVAVQGVHLVERRVPRDLLGAELARPDGALPDHGAMIFHHRFPELPWWRSNQVISR